MRRVGFHLICRRLLKVLFHSVILLCIISKSLYAGTLTATITSTPVTYETINSSFASSESNFGINFNGTITVVPSGGTGPYKYKLLNPVRLQDSATFTGLPPGSYTVQVNDHSGQFISKTIVITSIFPQPKISVSDTVYPSTCNSFDGSFKLTASGGTPPYEYSIDGGNTYTTSGVFTGLAQGYYSILLVRDANNFLASTAFNTPLTGQDFSCRCCKFSVLVDLTNANACGTRTGKVVAEAINGYKVQFSLDNIHYAPAEQQQLWDGGFAYVGTFYPAGGTSVIYAKDAAGNFSVTTIPIVNGCIIQPSASVVNASCGNRNGTITISVKKGIPPFTYSADGIHYQSSNIFTNMASGIYDVIVRDNDGTTNSVKAEVGDNCPKIQATVSAGSCGKNGVISVAANQGNPPYQYSINGINFQTDSSFSGLSSGNYVITIKDANGLMNTDSVTIADTNPPSIQWSATTASCDADGSMNAAASTGSVPLQFSLDSLPFQDSSSFTHINGGTHSLKVKDGNGCISSAEVVVPLVNNLQVNAGSDRSVCEGIITTIDASSNATRFSWQPVAGLKDPAVLNAEASPSISTTYTLTAFKGGCSATDSVHIDIKPAPLANAGPDTIICYGQSTTLEGSGGIRCLWIPADYLSDPYQFNPVVQHAERTVTYHLVVTNDQGCSSILDAPVEVQVTPYPKVSAGEDTASGYNQPIQLTASDSNHSGFYEYTWTPSEGLNNAFIQNPVCTISTDMIYTVSAIAPGGCKSSADVHIRLYAGPAIYVPGGFTPNGDGKNDILKTRPIGIRSFNYFTIYNRQGQRIFYSHDPGEGWDGTFNGAPQQSGGFVWMAEGIDINGKTIHRQGTVLLIR